MLDYILYIAYSILDSEKAEKKRIEESCKNYLSIVLFFTMAQLIAYSYMALIVLELLEYNKGIILGLLSVSAVVLYLFVFKRYKNDKFYKALEKISSRIHFSKNKLRILFTLILFVPIFTLWLGILVLRNYLY